MHSPRFANWLSKPGQEVHVLPDGVVRYSRATQGKTIVIPYRDGIADFSAYFHRGVPEPLRIPVLPGRSRTSAQRIADQREASRILFQRIQSGKVRSEMFTRKELDALEAGQAKVGDYTWHHGARSGTMELVRSDIHRDFSHYGWFSY